MLSSAKIGGNSGPPKLELQKLTRTQKMRKEEQDIGTKNTEKVK